MWTLPGPLLSSRCFHAKCASHSGVAQHLPDFLWPSLRPSNVHQESPPVLHYRPQRRRNSTSYRAAAPSALKPLPRRTRCVRECILGVALALCIILLAGWLRITLSSHKAAFYEYLSFCVLPLTFSTVRSIILPRLPSLFAHLNPLSLSGSVHRTLRTHTLFPLSPCRRAPTSPHPSSTSPSPPSPAPRPPRPPPPSSSTSAAPAPPTPPPVPTFASTPPAPPLPLSLPTSLSCTATRMCW